MIGCSVASLYRVTVYCILLLGNHDREHNLDDEAGAGETKSSRFRAIARAVVKRPLERDRVKI